MYTIVYIHIYTVAIAIANGKKNKMWETSMPNGKTNTVSEPPITNGEINKIEESSIVIQSPVNLINRGFGHCSCAWQRHGNAIRGAYPAVQLGGSWHRNQQFAMEKMAHLVSIVMEVCTPKWMVYVENHIQMDDD